MSNPSLILILLLIFIYIFTQLIWLNYAHELD